MGDSGRVCCIVSADLLLNARVRAMLIQHLTHLADYGGIYSIVICRDAAEYAFEHADSSELSSVRRLWELALKFESPLIAVENVFDADLCGPNGGVGGRSSLERVQCWIERQCSSVRAVVVDDVAALQELLFSAEAAPEVLQLFRDVVLDLSSTVDELGVDEFHRYWTEPRCLDEVKKRNAVRGIIRLRNNGTEGVVVSESEDESLTIVMKNKSDLNRAFDGDEVCVLLAAGRETGKVISVLRRSWRDYVATIQEDDDENDADDDSEAYLNAPDPSHALVVPMDRRVTKIRIRGKALQALRKKRILVRVDEWPITSRYPRGHLVEVLGNAADVDVESRALLLENGVSHCNYRPEEFAHDIRRIPWLHLKPKLSQTGVDSGRRDLRESHLILSVDPPGCRDIDDCLSVRRLPSGNLEVGVHIADVCAHLAPGSDLDLEARDRGTTVYLQDRRVNMLPEILCENACSLMPNVARRAVSVLAEFAGDSESFEPSSMLSSWCGRTLIQSSAALSYEEAQALVDRRRPEHAVTNALRELQRIGRVLLCGRKRNGALEVESFETDFEVSEDVIDVVQELDHVVEFHSTVAELMIFANRVVAERLYAFEPSRALLRSHAEPPKAKLDALKQVLQTIGVQLECLSCESVVACLEALERCGDEEWLPRIARSLLTRALAEANYVSANELELAQLRHFGLGVPLYTHFTSPIRRYADVMVHRLLLESLGLEAAAESSSSVAQVALQLNVRNRAAKFAQRASQDLFWSLYITQTQQQRTDAIVTAVHDTGVQVLLPTFSRKERVHLVDSAGRLQVFSDDRCRSPPDDALAPLCHLTVDESRSVLHVSVDDAEFDLRVFDRLQVHICPSQRENLYRMQSPLVRCVWMQSSPSPKASNQTRTRRELVDLTNVVAVQKPDSALLKSTSENSSTLARDSTIYSVLQKLSISGSASVQWRSGSERTRFTKSRMGGRMMWKKAQPHSNNSSTN